MYLGRIVVPVHFCLVSCYHWHIYCNCVKNISILFKRLQSCCQAVLWNRTLMMFIAVPVPTSEKFWFRFQYRI